MDWLQIGATLGVSTLFLIGIGLFVYRSVWPFVVKQIEAAQTERTTERNERKAERERVEAERAVERNRLLDTLNTVVRGQTDAINKLAASIDNAERQRSRTPRRE